VEPNNRRVGLTAAATLLLVFVAASAAAQGRGNAIGKGRQTPPPTVAPTAGGASSGVINVGAREFGAWLDDATLADPGSGWASIGLARYFSPVGHQTDVPSFDGAVGWTRRVQLGMTVPYSRFSALDGATASGRGDVYLTSKIALGDVRDRARRRTFAITPLIEVLSNPDPLTGKRAFWALPVSAETRAKSFRLYGSTGYFSRGVLFGGGAMEVPATERLVATAALTWTRSLKQDVVADAMGLTAARVDFSGGAAYAWRPSVTIFGSLGRTLSKIDANSATLALNTGLTFKFAAKTSKPIRP